MKTINLILCTSLIALMSACGGGGSDVGVTPTVSTTLATATDAQALQKLSIDTLTVAVTDQTTKGSSQPSWDSTKKLTYVTMLTDGDIVGLPATTIYRDVTFNATNKANVYLATGSSEYTMQDGSVTGAIDGGTGALSVTLNWAPAEISHYNEQGGTSDITSGLSIALVSSTSGSTCGAANLFCAGTLTIAKNGTTTQSDIALGIPQFKAGLYGSSSANAELAGRINYDNQTDLSVIGSFVAGQ